MISLDDATDDVDREFRKAMREFLSMPKSCRRPLRWREGKNHGEYYKSQVFVMHEMEQRRRARIVFGSHVYLEPRKYTFALLFGNVRIVSLDIEPRRSHRNMLKKQVVTTTHWSYYPCENAIPDNRTMSHKRWLDSFLSACNITFEGAYNPPVHDKEQLAFTF